MATDKTALKRLQGNLACRECRRLKIRCDRTIPCQSCVKRGCAALCPNNTIPPGEGGRFVVAAEDFLSGQIIKLQARTRALEDAIAVLHSTQSSDIHPLLVTPFDEDEGEKVNVQVERRQDAGSGTSKDAMGILCFVGNGSSSDVRFFGPTGGSETLLLKAKELETALATPSPQFFRKELDASYFPPDLHLYHQSFPLKPIVHCRQDNIQHQIESFLPTKERAIILCDTYLEHLSWMTQIVTRRQLVNELIPAAYRETSTPLRPHALGLLLISLALGSLLDLTQEPYNLEAQHYYFLARAAMTLQSVLTEQTITTIKALHLMSIYQGMSGLESNMEETFTLLNFASQVATAIGFHIDPSAWGIRGYDAYDRRCYFWNLLSGLMWQCLVTGRPPVVFPEFIQCKMPTESEEERYQMGEVPVGFGIWGFRATPELLIPVVKMVLAVKPPEYAQVLELDKKIRKFGLPNEDQDNSGRTAISMRTFVRSHYTDLMLLFLHRGHFALAIDHPSGNPDDSPYKASFHAAFGAACVVLGDTYDQYLKKPDLCCRIWMMWSFAFSSAVVVGTIAVKLPLMRLQPSPLAQFEVACEMFTAAARVNSRAARALPILHTMLHKARIAARLGHVPRPGDVRSQDYDELSLFKGSTSTLASINSGPAFRTTSRNSTNTLKPHEIQTQYTQQTGWHPGQHLGPELHHIENYGFLPIPPSPTDVDPSMRSDDRWTSFVHNYGIF